MRRAFSLLLAIAILTLTLPAGLALAKDAPTHAYISGPGINGKIEITDPSLAAQFGLGAFEQIPNSITAPVVQGGYFIDAYDGWDGKTYYLDISGGLGYVYYNGLTNGSSEFDGKWFRATVAGDAAIHRVLQRQGVLPSSLPTTGGQFPSGTWLIASAALLIGLGIIMYRIGSQRGQSEI